ncbi:unnamed protein product [Closterium sp. Naga37s-1]|nr:unnamed protein product [Closterium sp. Naga37s-1]
MAGTTITSPVARGYKSKRSKIIAMAVAAASASDVQPLMANATAADGSAEGAHSPGARERSNAEGGAGAGSRENDKQAGISRRKDNGGGKGSLASKGKSSRRGRMTGKRTESVPGPAGEEGAGNGGEGRASTVAGLQSSIPSASLQTSIPPFPLTAAGGSAAAAAAAAAGSAAASGVLQGMCGLSGEHALRSALVSAIVSRIEQMTGQGQTTQAQAQLLSQLQAAQAASVLASRHLRSRAPCRPFRRIPHFPLSPFRSASARRVFALYFRPADRSCIESSPMAARSSSRLLALAGRAVSARLAPVAPASALLAGNVAREFATAAPAEEDVVKAAFIKQQASFRSYLEGLKKVPIPMDAADDKATKAYAAAVKNIRESLGIPSFSEKLSNLLESAEEDSRDVRSFLEESRIIRRQLGVEDKLGAEKLMFAALDSVEKKLGKALVGDDVKGMAMLEEEVNGINKKLGLKDGELEPLEQQLETSMAKTDIAAFASEATQKIGTYQKRDGLEDIQVDLKTLDPKAYM